MFLTAIAGKTRQLDTLYIARQQDSPDSSGGAHQERFGGWYDRMLVPTWSDDFTRFVECASRSAVARRRHSGDEARRIVVESYKMSVAPSLLADLVEEPTVSWSMPMRAASGAAPGQTAADERGAPCRAWRAIGARDGCRTTSCTAPSSGRAGLAKRRGSSRRCGNSWPAPAVTTPERPARRRSIFRRCARTPVPWRALRRRDSTRRAAPGPDSAPRTRRAAAPECARRD